MAIVRTDTQKRDAKGRWKPGHTGNPYGRPNRAMERAYLDVMIRTCTIEDWRDITIRAIDDAKLGNRDARKWLSDYILGPASQVLAAIATVEHSPASEGNITRMAAILAQVALTDVLE